ncbi:hypothetical protein [Chitinophaga niabensis]|uniref:Uncharacterized protein n=1 Tax=Chitinophaga niabensis TaxID=536979 RepID=A0A1N6JQ19_9BACT|nr:hypothetical protein [Chitinophaga niabensis]SIO46333.1 hypothetical protein SAMN04488055_4254 [Chitinophaga niabensis]
MEEEPKDNFDWKLLQFFVKIVRTIFIGLILMMIDIFTGMYLGFGIPEESTPTRLTLFYIWFGLSMGAYIYFLWRLWRKKMPAP